MLTSLAIHAVPLTLTLNMRWNTIPNQRHLPLDEQRFAPFADTSTWEGFFENFFKWPLIVYFSWLIFYGIANFVVTRKVADYTYDSTYRTFTMNPSPLKQKLIKLPLPTPLIFLAFHFFYFFVLHCVSIVLYHNYWVNIIFCIFYLTMATYNGASWYFAYFAKKYEKQLEKLT